MTQSKLKNALLANRNWFLNSGILDPADGSHGVAERVLLFNNNNTANKSMGAFPAWKFFDGGCIIEQRRADCCFEVAYYFLLLHELFGNPEDKTIAENLLEYLYHRSALLSRDPEYTSCPVGVWNWSNLRWTPNIWVDDNAWCIILALKIAARRPDLDRYYKMTEYALSGAAVLETSFLADFNTPQRRDFWCGTLSQPHWGALAAGALALTAADFPNRAKTAADYFGYIDCNISTFNSSETAYALLGTNIATSAGCEHLLRDTLGRRLVQRLIAFINSDTGCPPSDHSEAPVGKHLCDLIYTVNFTLLALALFPGKANDPELSKAKDRLLSLILRIQDSNASQHLHGCWRGMYDLENECWGGGDCFEGGANSIYSGWTNAPIGWALLSETGIKW